MNEDGSLTHDEIEALQNGKASKILNTPSDITYPDINEQHKSIFDFFNGNGNQIKQVQVQEQNAVNQMMDNILSMLPQNIFPFRRL